MKIPHKLEQQVLNYVLEHGTKDGVNYFVNDTELYENFCIKKNKPFMDYNNWDVLSKILLLSPLVDFTMKGGIKVYNLNPEVEYQRRLINDKQANLKEEEWV